MQTLIPKLNWILATSMLVALGFLLVDCGALAPFYTNAKIDDKQALSTIKSVYIVPVSTDMSRLNGPAFISPTKFLLDEFRALNLFVVIAPDTSLVHTKESTEFSISDTEASNYAHKSSADAFVTTRLEFMQKNSSYGMLQEIFARVTIKIIRTDTGTLIAETERSIQPKNSQSENSPVDVATVDVIRGAIEALQKEIMQSK